VRSAEAVRDGSPLPDAVPYVDLQRRLSAYPGDAS
jgi:hypothetical protein